MGNLPQDDSAAWNPAGLLGQALGDIVGTHRLSGGNGKNQTNQVVIGVTPAFDEGNKLPASRYTLYLRREYTKILASLGAVPIILTPDMPMDYIIEICDGIVISGGEDIPAEVYGGENINHVLEPLERVMWELLLIDRCGKQKIPVLGVCYGMQLIALYHGGQLCPDIARYIPGSIKHVSINHDVKMSRDFLGLRAGETVVVASRHHQCVSVIPDGFELCGLAQDGVIEAMYGQGMYGTQWHPESDATGARIYASFIEECRRVDRPSGAI